MDDDLVAMNDVLMAMADSVMEKQPKPFNPSLKFQDRKIDFKIGGKPPREIFYRKTVTFMTKLPPPVQNKICSCQYLCSGDIATIKCHSCSIYDPAGQSFYCNACFHSRHPWYRVGHIHTPIVKDESIEHTLKIAHRMAEAKRYEKEGVDLLTGLRSQLPTLQYIADDEKVDNQLRIYGRRMVALEEHIDRLREFIKEDIEVSATRKCLKKSLPALLAPPPANPSPPSAPLDALVVKQSTTPSHLSVVASLLPKQQELVVTQSSELVPETTQSESTSTDLVAVTHASDVPPSDPSTTALVVHSEGTIHGLTKLQACYRRWIGQRIVSSLVMSRTLKVWSPENGRDFYYDRITCNSSWIPSKFLRPEHFDQLEYIHDPSSFESRFIWYCKKLAPRKVRKKAMKRKTATRILQGFGRCILARYRIIAQANSMFRRVYDEESAAYYYANVISGESSWEKPRIYLSLEPPVYIHQEGDVGVQEDADVTGSARFHGRVKRSPRVNRIHTSED